MNKKALAYTLLKNFANFEKIIEVFDKDVENKAVSSYATTCGYGKSFESVENLTYKILQMIERKRCIIQCRLAVLSALEKMKTTEVDILRSKFINKQTFEQIGNTYNIAPIQARREFIKAVKNYYLCIARIPEFKELCTTDLYFYNGLKIDYFQAIKNQNLARVGLI